MLSIFTYHNEWRGPSPRYNTDIFLMQIKTIFSHLYDVVLTSFSILNKIQQSYTYLLFIHQLSFGPVNVHCKNCLTLDVHIHNWKNIHVFVWKYSDFFKWIAMSIFGTFTFLWKCIVKFRFLRLFKSCVCIYKDKSLASHRLQH